MTTGSWSYDHTLPTQSGLRYGRKGSKVWDGLDATSPRGKVQDVYEIVKRGGLPPTKVVVDHKVPAKAPKRARLPENPYQMRRSSLDDQFARFYYSDGSLGASTALLQTCVSVGTPTSILSSNDQIKLVNKLGEKFQGSDFNMSVLLGEGHQTLRLIADSATRVGKALWHLRKGDITGSARSLLEGTSRKPLKPIHDWKRKAFWDPNSGNWSGHWLELQYGWLPLLSDAEGAAYMLAHHLNVPLRATYRVKVQKQSVDNNVPPSGVDVGLATVKGSLVKTSRRYLVAKIAEKSTIPKLLGLQNPLAVAWELLPFSFVADWFIPIGSYLEARGFSQGLSGTFITTDVNRWVGLPPGNWPGYPANGSTMWVETAMARTVSDTLDVPLPVVQPLNKVFSWQHCANAIALAVQQGSGFRPVR